MTTTNDHATLEAGEEAERRYPNATFSDASKSAAFISGAAWQASQSALSSSERAETLAVLEPFLNADHTGSDLAALSALAARLRSAPSESLLNAADAALKRMDADTRTVEQQIEDGVAFIMNCPLGEDAPAGNTVAVQDGLIRLANDLRIDPWIRREIIELLEPVKDWHHPVGLTMNAPTAEPAQGEVLEKLAKRMFKMLIVDDHEELRTAWEDYHEAASAALSALPPAGDTVTVKREWLENLLADLRLGYRGRSRIADEITRILDEKGG